MPEPLLDISHISVAFNGVGILDDVSIRVPQGGAVAIVGESGSGKSTLVRAALGILEHNGAVTGGSISFDGLDLTHAGPKEYAKVRGTGMSLIFQDPQSSFSPVRTLDSQFLEAMRRVGPISKQAAHAKAIGLLSKVEIDEPERVLAGYSFELSGGMCQRAAIALALSQNPRLLIGDELTSALDVLVQAQIVDELADLRASLGMAMLVITHNLGLAFHLADTVYVMYAGQVVECGEAEELRNRPLHPYTRALLASVPQFGGVEPRGIPGLPATPGEMPSGCRFEPRCACRTHACKGAAPKLTEIDDGHSVMCPFATTDRLETL